jgi:hypothetical protein
MTAAPAGHEEAPSGRIHPFANRPKTLAEVVRRSTDMDALSIALPEFLDTFYGHIKRGDLSAAAASLAEEPPLATSPELQAYIGGVAEHLCRRWSLPTIPSWVEHPSRFLKSPVFELSSPEARRIYLIESPLAFRRRLIFTEAVPLRRARMPTS